MPKARDRYFEFSQEGAAEEELSGTELYDIRPSTVGFVRRGANRRPIFLAKSEESMPTDPSTSVDPSEEELLSAFEGDQQAAADEELDLSALESIEQAAPKPGEEDPDETPEEEDKKQKKGVLALAQAVYQLITKRPRDPVVAAQRALSTLGGHPEFNSVVKELIDFIEKVGGARQPGKPDGYPNPGYPYPKPGDKKPLKQDGQPSETGDHSVANAGNPPVAPAGNPPGTPPVSPPLPVIPDPSQGDPMDLTQVKSIVDDAVKPLQQRLDASEAERKKLEAKLAERESSEVKASLVPIAKSAGLPVETVQAMKGALTQEQFDAVMGNTSRWRKAAVQAGLFEERGTSALSEMPSEETLLQKSAEALMKAKPDLDFAQALIQASEESGVGLDRPRELREEG